MLGDVGATACPEPDDAEGARRQEALGDDLDDQLIGRDSTSCRLVSDALGDLGRQVNMEPGHHISLPLNLIGSAGDCPDFG